MPSDDAENKKTERSLSIIEEMKYSLENVQSLIQFADSKANTLLTIHALLITLLSAALFFEDVQTPISVIWDQLTLLLILSLLLISASFSISVLIPREASDQDSLLYYKKIASFEDHHKFFKEYAIKLDHEIAQGIASQVYEVSKIVETKMQHIKYSMIFLSSFFVSLLIGSGLIIFIFT